MKHVYCFLLSIIIFTGCEYKIHENFIDRGNPDEQIRMSYDLNAMTDGESILIFGNTSLAFSFTAFENKVASVKFTLGEYTWEFNEPNGELYISEFNFDDGIYILKCTISAKTEGSGSVAEQAGLMYEAELSWPVIIDFNSGLPTSLLTSRINENGFLELRWGSMTLSHLQPLSYTLESGLDIMELPVNATSFTDKMYVGQRTSYRLYVNLLYEEKQILQWFIGEVELEESFRFYTESEDLDYVILKWDLPYRALLEIQIDENPPFFVDENDTFIKVPVTYFGSSSGHELSKVLVTLNSYTQVIQPVITKEFYLGSPGIHFEHKRGADWVYNSTTGLLYAVSYDSIVGYSLPDIHPMINAAKPPGHGGTLSSPVSNKLYLVSDQITVLNGKTFSKEATIPIQAFHSDYRFVTRDEKLIQFYTEPGEYHTTMAVYNPDGSLYRINKVEGYPKITIDGKYMINYTGAEITISELSDYVIKQTKEYNLSTNSYIYYFLHPLYPEEIYLLLNDKLEVRDCRDFSLIRTMPYGYTNCVIENIDPLTGHILIYHYSVEGDFLTVVSRTGEELFRIKCASAISPALYGNTLISYDGFLLNLDKYVKR